MKIQPKNNNLLIEVTKQDKTKSGIILAIKDDLVLEQAKIIATCKGSEYKSGDVVFYKTYSLDTIEQDDKLYHFIKEDQVLGVQK